MRKLTLLALAALIAGTVYAETSPAFTGSFEFYATFDTFDSADKGKDNDEGFVIGNNYDAKISINGVIDEWTTVNAEITKKRFEVAERIIDVEKGEGNTEDTVQIGDTIVTDMDSYKIDNDGDDKFGKTIVDLKNANNGENVYDTDEYDTMVLNEFTMTNNLTGALGFADSPVGVSVTWGKTNFEPAKFHKVAGFDYLEHKPTDSYLGVKTAITIVDKVKLVTGVFPETYLNNFYKEGRDKAPAFGFDMQLLELVENLNVNAFVTIDPNKDTDDDSDETEGTKQVGLTAGYSGLENWNFGLVASYYFFKFDDDLSVEKREELKLETDDKLDKAKFGIGISASYNMNDRFYPSLAFVIEEFPKKHEVGSTSITTPLKGLVGLGMRFKAIPDVLDFVFSMQLPLEGETVSETGGKETKTKPYKKEVGKRYVDSGDFEFEVGLEAFLGEVTYGLGYDFHDRNHYSPNGDDSSGFYFKAKASF